MKPRMIILSVLLFAGSFVLLVIAGEILDALLGIEWLAVVLALLFVFVFWVAGVFIVGMILPRTRLVARSMTLSRKPALVWQELVNSGGLPAAIVAQQATVERLPDRDGRPAWRFTSSGCQTTIEASEAIADRRLVTRAPSWGGTAWSAWDLQELQGSTRVTATWRLETTNPFVRFASRVMSFTTGIGVAWGLEANLKALAAHCGELDTAAIEPAKAELNPERG